MTKIRRLIPVLLLLAYTVTVHAAPGSDDAYLWKAGVARAVARCPPPVPMQKRGTYDMGRIQNRGALLQHGNVEARRIALDIANYALEACDPYGAARSLVNLDEDILTVGQLKLDLRNHGKVYVLGAGKATFPVVKALEDVLGDRIADGVSICKYGEDDSLTRVRVRLANHPVPDKAGLEAAFEIAALAKNVLPKDIVFCVFTGGSSALMPMPVEGVTLDEKKEVNRLLLRSGANIIEINAVRKHLSQIKGGRLARMINPEACIINLTVSDVIGDALDYITCPTVPDTSTFDDARATLTKYRLWDSVPASVRRHLETGPKEGETPKAEDLAHHNIHSFILASGRVACEAAYKRAKELGYSSMILSTMLEGESREVGSTFAAIAKEILAHGRPVPAPCVIIGGGETTVRIGDEPGEGGPNQEFTLGAALWLDDVGSVAVLGLDTDGTDGPTQLAGGLSDNFTLKRARAAGLDVFAALETHDVSRALRILGDVVITGATGTNVNDLKMMVVLPE